VPKRIFISYRRDDSAANAPKNHEPFFNSIGHKLPRHLTRSGGGISPESCYPGAG
jgi:hypothetical protein